MTVTLSSWFCNICEGKCENSFFENGENSLVQIAWSRGLEVHRDFKNNDLRRSDLLHRIVTTPYKLQCSRSTSTSSSSTIMYIVHGCSQKTRLRTQVHDLQSRTSRWIYVIRDDVTNDIVLFVHDYFCMCLHFASMLHASRSFLAQTGVVYPPFAPP